MSSTPAASTPAASSSPARAVASAARSPPRCSRPATGWSPPRAVPRPSTASSPPIPTRSCRWPSTSPTPPRPRRRIAAGASASAASTSSSTTRGTPTSPRSRRHPRRLPRPDRDQPLRRRQRDQGGVADPARAGRRPHRPGLLDRRPLATPGLAAYQSAKWGGRRLLRRPRRRGRAARHHVTVLEPGACRPTGPAPRCRCRRSRRPTSRPSAAPPRCTTPRPRPPATRQGRTGRLEVAAMDDPPLRLILGSEAYAYATARPRPGRVGRALARPQCLHRPRRATTPTATRSAPAT